MGLQGQHIPPRNSNKVITAGDTIVIEDTVENPDGSAKDLTGASIFFVVERYPGSPPGQVYLDVTEADSEVTITDAAGGVVECKVPPSVTEDLGDYDGRDYHYTIQVDDGGGPVTVTAGDITIYA